MTFHVVTIFPEFFREPFRFGVVGKALADGRVGLQVHDLRSWAYDRHRTVDDRPFGGGEGMLVKPEPVFQAVETIFPQRAPERQRVVLLSAQGARFDQGAARRLVGFEEVLLICGRYEGVDERVAEHLADEELSIGDFVLSGGEWAAAVVIDATIRLVPGVVGNEQSTLAESFSEPGMLDCPHYTRPADFRGFNVPEGLLGGNHAAIAAWRRRAAWAKTARLRPDLLAAEGPDERK